MSTAFVNRNFSRYAQEYDRHARLQRRVASELASRTKNFYGKVADLGAGTGYMQEFSALDITPVDISPEMCRVLGENAVCADIQDLPFPDESFDNAVSNLAMQWMQEPDKAYAEVYRILKKGGKFGFSTFTTGTLAELKNSFSYLDNDRHIMDFDPAILLFSRLKKAGFGDIVISSQRITYRYKNIMELLVSIKNIGASYSGERSFKGLRGKKYFEQLENLYLGKYNHGGMLPVTWEVLYITAEKQ